MAEAILPDSSVIKVPDFALESTQAQMLALLKILIKDDDKTRKLYEELIKETKDNQKDNKKANDKQKETLDKIQKQSLADSKGSKGSFRKNVADRLEADVQGVFLGAGRAISGLAVAAVTATTAIAGFGIKMFTGLTDNLKDLTMAGLGFTDSLGNTASGAILEFNKLGYSTQEAAQQMIKFAGLTATLGRSGSPSSLAGVIKRFGEITRNGADLGLGFKEANDALMEELETRQQMGTFTNRVDMAELASATKLVGMQTAYASILGVSADKLREQNKQTLTNNTGLVSLMQRFGNSVYEGASGFNIAMAASGENLGKLSQILLEAGTMSNVYISDAARELAYAGFGELTTSMEQFQQNITKGGIRSAEAGAAAATQIQNQLAGILDNTKEGRDKMQRLRAIIEAGGAGAEMAKLIILSAVEAKRVREKMAELAKALGKPGEIDDLLKARNTFDMAIAKISGSFENVKNSLMIKFAPTLSKLAEALELPSGGGQRSVLEAIQQGIERIKKSILRLFGLEKLESMNPEEMRKAINEKIDSISKGISDFIDDIKKFVDGLPRNAEGSINWKTAMTGVGVAIFTGLLTAFGEFLKALPGMLIDGIVGNVKSWFNIERSDEEKVAGGMVDGILTVLGAIFTAGFAKSISVTVIKSMGTKMSSMMGSAFDLVKEKVFRIKPPATPSPASTSIPETIRQRSPQGIWRTVKNPDFPGPGGAPGATPTAGAPASAPKGPGLMDKISSGMKSLGSGIASLGAGIGRMIASIGKGGGVGIAAIFQGLSTGVASLGKVSVLKGVGVMTLLAAPVFLVGEAFKSWADVKWQDVALGIGAITGLAVVAGVIGNGFFVPILLGAAALGALGLALQLFPVDTITALGDVLNKVVNTVMVNMPPIITAVGDALAKLIEVGAKGFDTIMNSVGTLLERMNLLDPVRLAEVAGAITLVGGSLAALGLGSVIGGIGKFMGSLFGGGDPLDRLLKVADSAPKLDQLSESLKKLAVVIGETGGMIERLSVLPLESVVDDFSRLWKNLSKVELNVKPYLDFTALDTDKMIQNAEAINRVAMANKKQNEAYQEFIKLDNNNFRRNVEAAFDMNAAARGQTSRDSLTETISNLFSSLFRSPATPTPPTATNPAAPPNATPSGSSTTGQTIPPVPTPIERNARGQTQLDVLTQIQFDIQAQKTILEAIRDHTQ